MLASDLNLKELLQFTPQKGQITFGSQRVVLLSVETIGNLVDEMINIGDLSGASVVLRRCGEAAGRELARQFKNDFNPANVEEWLAFGPTMHAWEGVALPSLEELAYDQQAGSYLLHVKMANSYLAQQYLKRNGVSDEPVCWMLSGHISGYCSEVFGMDLLCREVKCVAQGDEACEFIVKPRSEWFN